MRQPWCWHHLVSKGKLMSVWILKPEQSRSASHLPALSPSNKMSQMTRIWNWHLSNDFLVSSSKMSSAKINVSWVVQLNTEMICQLVVDTAVQGLAMSSRLGSSRWVTHLGGWQCAVGGWVVVWERSIHTECDSAKQGTSRAALGADLAPGSLPPPCSSSDPSGFHDMFSINSIVFEWA
jgi:hypothetical protein